ncbi:MAG: hypothetical protein K2K55_10145 [Duncaniella sp.]|nr:hypothetical protein [Duncaniella sp.]
MNYSSSAIVTQTYRMDYDECCLLCESIDRFAPGMRHYIFVNDEDLHMFAHLASDHRFVMGKSVLLPKWLIRMPWKILGHKYHVSPFTIPVREWIIQQICKLAVFEVLPEDVEAVYNFDSEVVLLRDFDPEALKRDGRYPLFMNVNPDEPSQDDYIHSARRLLGLSDDEVRQMADKCFMTVPVCFERKTLQELLDHIERKSVWPSWKLALANTYRFSEYYTYGIFATLRRGMEGHYPTDIHRFPVVDISLTPTEKSFRETIGPLLASPDTLGLWLQKRDRKNLSSSYLPNSVIRSILF